MEKIEIKHAQIRLNKNETSETNEWTKQMHETWVNEPNERNMNGQSNWTRKKDEGTKPMNITNEWTKQSNETNERNKILNETNEWKTSIKQMNT